MEVASVFPHPLTLFLRLFVVPGCVRAASVSLSVPPVRSRSLSLDREAQSAQVRLTLSDGTQRTFQAQVKVRRGSMAGIHAGSEYRAY